MAAMMLMLKIFNNAHSPRLLRAALFFTAWLFLSGFHFFLYFHKPNPAPFYLDMISRLLYHKFC